MKEKALRETQIRNIHEMREMKRAQELRVDEFSVQKLKGSHETIQRFTSQMQEMQEQMNSMNDSQELQEVESNHSSQPAAIPSFRSMLSRDNACHSTHGMRLDHRKTFLVTNVLRLIRHQIIVKEFIILRHQVFQDRFQCILVQELLSQEMKRRIGAQFQCRHLQEGRRP